MRWSVLEHRKAGINRLNNSYMYCYLEFFYERRSKKESCRYLCKRNWIPLTPQTTETLILELSRSGGRFELVVGEQKFKQTTCEFMLTFSSLQGKNMDEYMTNLANEFDQVRVPISGCGRSVTLLLSDFARLRSLYGQRMFELKLEDMLMRQGIATQETTFKQSFWI